MKCEECLALLEEYTDGELDGRATRLVASHVAACALCAGACEELRREQAIYAGYRREVDISPALWNRVRAQIDSSSGQRAVGEKKWAVGSDRKAVFSSSLVRLRERFADMLSPRRLSYAVAVVLAIVAIGTTVSVMRYVASRGSAPGREVVERSGSRNNSQPTPDSGQLVADGDAAKQGAEMKHREDGNLRVTSRQRAGEEDRSKALLAADDKRVKRIRSKPRDPGAVRAPDEVVHETGRGYGATYDMTANAYPVERGQLLGPEAETARHVERAELLLRSFRNADLSGERLDLAYEQQHSRKLLYKNILLRRDAAAKGDAPTEELLGSLEPVLLDIANLPNNPAPEDVRAVRERMRRKEIVAALQVHSVHSPRMNY